MVIVNANQQKRVKLLSGVIRASAVVAFNREVDDDFLTVDIDGPAVWHLTHQPPPLIVGTVLSSSARVDSSRAQDRLFSHSPL